MGAVYEVLHLETNRRRALKVMHPHLFQSEELRERFKLEARIAAEVDSEYIVDVSDAGVDEATETPFLVMELLRGEELGARLKRLGPMPPEEVVMYLQQMAWALDRTHAASIIHRDLKPANLFLTTREDGTPRIKILDFGVAKLIAESSMAAEATQSVGTPLYMAPEQFRANYRLTGAADIHALTLLTYTLLVGKAYWAEEAKSMREPIAFAMLVVKGPQESAVERAARRGVALPRGFDAWFAKGTAVDPADRFTTATEAVQALRAVHGQAGLGVASIAMRPAMASEAGMSLAQNRPAIPSVAMLEPAVISTGVSSMTTAPAKRSHVSLVAAAVMLGLAVVGTGTWLALRQGHASPEASNQAVPATRSAVPAVSSVAQVQVVPSTPVVPSASASAVAAPSTVVTTAPSTRAGTGGKAIPKPAASATKSVVIDPNDFSRH
jgi:serine/threonine-protein kinase